MLKCGYFHNGPTNHLDLTTLPDDTLRWVFCLCLMTHTMVVNNGGYG